LCEARVFSFENEQSAVLSGLHNLAATGGFPNRNQGQNNPAPNHRLTPHQCVEFLLRAAFRGCFQWVLDTACQAVERPSQPLGFESLTLCSHSTTDIPLDTVFGGTIIKCDRRCQYHFPAPADYRGFRISAGRIILRNCFAGVVQYKNQGLGEQPGLRIYRYISARQGAADRSVRPT